MKLFLSLIVFVSALGCGTYGLYWSFLHGFVRFNYPSQKSYPIQGLDVSHHQGVIEWDKIDTKKFKFVYMKATEGGDFIDKKFKINWEAAKNAGIVVGAYHFYSFCRPVDDQVLNLITIVPLEKQTMPPALDLEFGGNCKRKPNEEKLKKDISRFSEKIKEHYGKKPVLYMTKRFYRHYNMADFDEHKIWFRNIYAKPMLPKSWDFWQYANRGRIEGVSGMVDMNAFVGSPEDFKSILL